MYSYEERMRAMRLYIKYGQRPAVTIRELGYPSRGMLRSWYREFRESGDLHHVYRRRPRYSNEQKMRAVEYYRARESCRIVLRSAAFSARSRAHSS